MHGEQVVPLEQVPALRHRVRQRLEDLIVSGVLEPGSRLVENDLADTLGVSRGPIREALQQLARDGFVDLLPRQGAFVHQPSRKEIDDFFDVRRALEAEAARLAAQRVTPEGSESLRATLKAGQAMLAKGQDPSTGGVKLHDEILALAANDFLSQMLGVMQKRARWYMLPFDPTRREHAWEEHKEIVEAIASGDADRAADVMRRHIEGARVLYKMSQKVD